MSRKNSAGTYWSFPNSIQEIASIIFHEHTSSLFVERDGGTGTGILAGG